MVIRLATPGLFSRSKRTQFSVSESVMARLNWRMMVSGVSISRMRPVSSFSDLDILAAGLVRLMIRAPTLGTKGSGSLNTSP